jgi:8-oxo-dGTP pyrophosphatase MutT (NUDIX family)
VPVVVHHALTLKPIEERSGRDGEMKTYQYVAYRAGAHDQFASQVVIRTPHIWLAGYEALSREFRPLSSTSVKIIGQLTEAGLAPGRHQLASTVLLSRGPDEAPEFLMHPNASWGYSFPSKRREAGESPMSAANRVATEELGLQPGVTVTLKAASEGPITYKEHSESADVDTFYVQSLFKATLHDGAKLASKNGLAWVPLLDIVNGSTASPRTTGDAKAKPGAVSKTARTILEALDYF